MLSKSLHISLGLLDYLFLEVVALVGHSFQIPLQSDGVILVSGERVILDLQILVFIQNLLDKRFRILLCLTEHAKLNFLLFFDQFDELSL
jgi:hypothetical protein